MSYAEQKVPFKHIKMLSEPENFIDITVSNH